MFSDVIKSNKKILVINTVGLNYEGITSVIYNYTNAMDHDGLEFDFVAQPEVEKKIAAKFCELGKLRFVTRKKESVKKYIFELNKLLAQNHYDVVHIHGNSGTMALETTLCKLHRINRIIVHCHTTSCDHQTLNKILRYPMIHMADTHLACSGKAGKWLYGNRDFTVLNNAIDCGKYSFSEYDRNEIKNQFGIKENDFVIGHIGHFTKPKNHTFLIDIFYEFQKINPHSKLFLLSDGPLLDEVKKKVSSLRLDDSVIFAGRREDAYLFYNAFDIFVFPSLWEGLGMVMLEAQANGLPVLASDVIPREAKCNSNVFFKRLDDGAEGWAKEISVIENSNIDRKRSTENDLRRHGFDIKEESEKLKKIYKKD